MPELPEVETVKRGLQKILRDKSVLQKVHFYRKNLRFPLPQPQDIKPALGLKVGLLERRAKYLLLPVGEYTFVSHLGMTGTWRWQDLEPRKHDHIRMIFKNGLELIYNDPRRFGFFEFHKTVQVLRSKHFAELGPEPFELTGEELFLATRKRAVTIKNFIMNQKHVVGVGNIYASEALFSAGVRPTLKASRMSLKKATALVEAIKDVLNQAITAGGTTISDFKSAEGELGYFQNQLQVYGRKGEPCTVCGKRIKMKVLNGRSTYWCGSCQKY